MRENQVSGDPVRQLTGIMSPIARLLDFLAYKYNVQSGKNHCGHAYNSQVQEIIDLNKCKKERLFMEERDDLEQMTFIQKWNDGKAEREKKREQMWNGILEKAGIKKEEK